MAHSPPATSAGNEGSLRMGCNSIAMERFAIGTIPIGILLMLDENLLWIPLEFSEQ